MARVLVEHDFNKPVDKVFAYLSEHEHLADVFGSKIKRKKDGDDGHRNGVGSVRALRVGPGPWFDETVTEFVPNERIRYRITKGSPLRNHEGIMEFSPRGGGGSHLRYEITFDGKLPGVAAIVATMLSRNIPKGLRTVEAKA